MEPPTKMRKRELELAVANLMSLPKNVRMELVIRLPTIEDVMALCNINKAFYVWCQKEFVLIKWERANICEEDGKRKLAERVLYQIWNTYPFLHLFDENKNEVLMVTTEMFPGHTLIGVEEGLPLTNSTKDIINRHAGSYRVRVDLTRYSIIPKETWMRMLCDLFKAGLFLKLPSKDGNARYVRSEIDN